MTNNKVSSHSILAYTEAMVVDHLQGETGLSTVCANRSKDAGRFDPSDWPFVVYPKSTTDRKRLGRVNHNHNPMIIANGKHISTRIFRLESLDPLSTRSIYFGNFPVGPTWSSQNFPIIYILTEISGIFG